MHTSSSPSRAEPLSLFPPLPPPHVWPSLPAQLYSRAGVRKEPAACGAPAAMGRGHECAVREEKTRIVALTTTARGPLRRILTCSYEQLQPDGEGVCSVGAVLR